MGWRHYIIYLWSPRTHRHVVGQGMFGMWSKMDVPSTATIRRNNRLVLLDSEHKLQPTTTNYANVGYYICWPTTWRQQHWPQTVTANDVNLSSSYA